MRETDSGTDPADAKVRALARRQAPGRALDRAFYCDPDLYRRDLDRVLMRHWLCAGHESEIPKPGDYFLHEMAGESVIVARGPDGVVRAHANVCRHRGSRVCAERSGNAKVFVCPYHAWAYNLDGTLRAARHMPADFDAASHGLKPVHLEIVEGLILVSLAPAPLGLAHARATIADCLGPYGWTKAKIAHRARYPIVANWKLAVENYLECYHCAPAHPEYSALHALEQPWDKIQALNAAMERRAGALGIEIPTHEHWGPSAEGEEAVYGFRYALYEGVSTGSREGRPVAPLMGRFSDYDGGASSVHFGPASFFLAYPDHGVIYRFVPATADTCELEVLWLVREDARAGKDYDLDALIWLWTVTSEADKRIVENNQKGVNSRYYEPGPLAPMEGFERRYLAWYVGEIA